MKSFYILDISEMYPSSMYSKKIVRRHHFIKKMIEDNQETLDKDAMIFEWTLAWGHLNWLIDDLESAYPEATIWFVGDECALLEEDLHRVNHITLPIPSIADLVGIIYSFPL